MTCSTSSRPWSTCCATTAQQADRAPTPDLSGSRTWSPRPTRRVPVALEVDGPVERPCPSPVGTAAYRIVQESLTNVVRHAGATHATCVAVRRRARPWT